MNLTVAENLLATNSVSFQKGCIRVVWALSTNRIFVRRHRMFSESMKQIAGFGPDQTPDCLESYHPWMPEKGDIVSPHQARVKKEIEYRTKQDSRFVYIRFWG